MYIGESIKSGSLTCRLSEIPTISRFFRCLRSSDSVANQLVRGYSPLPGPGSANPQQQVSRRGSAPPSADVLINSSSFIPGCIYRRQSTSSVVNRAPPLGVQSPFWQPTRTNITSIKPTTSNPVSTPFPTTSEDRHLTILQIMMRIYHLPPDGATLSPSRSAASVLQPSQPQPQSRTLKSRHPFTLPLAQRHAKNQELPPGTRK